LAAGGAAAQRLLERPVVTDGELGMEYVAELALGEVHLVEELHPAVAVADPADGGLLLVHVTGHLPAGVVPDQVVQVRPNPAGKRVDQGAESNSAPGRRQRPNARPPARPNSAAGRV